VNCPNLLDEYNGRTCGDEGQLCESCMKEEAAYWLAEFNAAPLSERDPEEYERQMREAGRGHLLP
jgi:hypothetical protein